MMKCTKVIYLILILMVFSAITGCGETEESSNQGGLEINQEPLEVELIMPEKTDPGTTLTIKTLVTQGEEKVSDASEVEFEIWMRGEKEGSEFIEAALTDEGVYEITYKFTEEELYFVQPHVTARGMHRMPLGEIQVGEVAEEGNENNDHNGHSHDHHHHDNLLKMDWLTDEVIQKGEPTKVTVSIESDGEKWTSGMVQFEIWQHGDERREWVQAEEEEHGIYSATHVFEDTEEYHIIVHMEDEELHEHTEKIITIESS